MADLAEKLSEKEGEQVDPHLMLITADRMATQ